MNTGTGRRGREGFAEVAKGIQKTFECFFCAFCETFAPSASGCPIPPSSLVHNPPFPPLYTYIRGSAHGIGQ